MAKKKEITRTEIKELGRIKTLDRLFEKSSFKNSETSFLPQKKGGKGIVTTNKLMLEGVDFDLTYTPVKYLGYKAAVHAMGYVYAQNAKPCALNFSIGVSSKFSYEHIDWLWAGIQAAAKLHSVDNLTLDLVPSMSGLMISCSASGEVLSPEQGKEVAPNSLICISGNLGSACMGFYVLEREKAAFTGSQPQLEKYKYPLGQYLTPDIEPSILDSFREAGLWPTAGYFLTRGLGDAVRQMARDHRCGANIFLDKIPVAPEARMISEEIGIDMATAIINGGDDYRLMYVFPLEAHETIRKELPFLEVIGHTAKEGCHLVSPDGNYLEIKAQGWE